MSWLDLQIDILREFDCAAKGRRAGGPNTEGRYVGRTAEDRARRAAGLVRSRGERGADTRRRTFATLPMATSGGLPKEDT